MTPSVRSSHLSTKSFGKGSLVDSGSMGHTNPSIDDDDEMYSYNDLKSTRQDIGSFVATGDDWSLESGVGPKEEPQPADVSTLAESDIYTTHEKEEEAPKVDKGKSKAAESVFTKGDADRVPVNISFSTEETVDTDEEASLREFDVDDFREGPVSVDDYADENEEVDLDALADIQLEPQNTEVEPIATENKEDEEFDLDALADTQLEPQIANVEPTAIENKLPEEDIPVEDDEDDEVSL